MRRKPISMMEAVLGLLLAFAPMAMGQRADWSAEVNRILSRLQAMGHGYHTQAEWNDVLQQIDDVSARARNAGAWETLVDLRAIKTMVFSEMLGDHPKALAFVRQARADLAPFKPRNMSKLFVSEAAVLARMGDEAAIDRLIQEYRTSPFYEPERYAFSGGWGREVPLTLVRPTARGGDAIAITTMEKYRRQARFAPGRPFPDFEGTTLDGRRIRLSNLRGQVVLVDLWVRHSLPWQRDIPDLVRLYNQFGQQGFVILGVNLERDTTGLAEFLQTHGIRWPQIVGTTDLPAQLGIYGDTTRFLVDRNGIIVGRDLKGAQLSAAVRRALGVP